MNAQKSSKRDKKSGATASPFSLVGILATLLIVLFCAFFLWHQFGFQESSTQRELIRNGIADEISVPEKVVPEQEEISKGGKTVTRTDDITTSSSIEKNTIATTTEYTATEKTSNTPVNQSETESTLARQLLDTSSHPSAQPAFGPDQEPIAAAEGVLIDGNCDQAAQKIHQFYQHLDNQKYMEKYAIQPSSEQYFSALIQKLIDNPPVVSGETDDLFTILKNTAHFFRIIGKQNIGILKEILNNEHDQFENILAKYYTIIHSPQCSVDHFNLTLPDPALYNYAGFFLSTMGGRLYLFRRDSQSRMVISYYAILLIDRANAHSNNKHGIEISSSIDLLIDEMESTTDTLVFKEKYLDTLYTLKEQYQ